MLDTCLFQNTEACGRHSIIFQFIDLVESQHGSKRSSDASFRLEALEILHRNAYRCGIVVTVDGIPRFLQFAHSLCKLLTKATIGCLWIGLKDRNLTISAVITATSPRDAATLSPRWLRNAGICSSKSCISDKASAMVKSGSGDSPVLAIVM
jgi:hypothetical protein